MILASQKFPKKEKNHGTASHPSYGRILNESEFSSLNDTLVHICIYWRKSKISNYAKLHQLSNKLAAEIKWDSCCTQVQMNVCQSVKIILILSWRYHWNIWLFFFFTHFDLITAQTWPSLYVVIEIKDILPRRRRWSLFSSWPLFMGTWQTFICETEQHHHLFRRFPFFLKPPATCWLIILIEYFKVLTFERF